VPERAEKGWWVGHGKGRSKRARSESSAESQRDGSLVYARRVLHVYANVFIPSLHSHTSTHLDEWKYILQCQVLRHLEQDGVGD
jgi:hypothetical protein